MFREKVIFTFVFLVCNAELSEVYKPRNFTHDDLNDDINNVPDDAALGDLSWDEVFKQLYEDERENEQREADLLTYPEKKALGSQLKMQHKWSGQELGVGGLSGVAVNSKGVVHLLHRSGREWMPNSFGADHKFQGGNNKIVNNTIVAIDPISGKSIKQWGKNLLVLPHGLTIDHNDLMYITDVALHQMLRLKNGKVDLEVGEAFQPSIDIHDIQRLCQPTSVAVCKNGDFFIADGYCNSRVVKYDRQGGVKGILGKGDFDIPHSVALMQEEDLLCVADREAMRVLCYNAGIKNSHKLGQQISQYMHPKVGPVYAITFNHQDSLLYGVAAKTGGLPAVAFTLDVLENPIYSSDFVSFWTPDGEEEDEEDVEESKNETDKQVEFSTPHDVTTGNSRVYVVQPSPSFLWCFQRTSV